MRILFLIIIFCNIGLALSEPYLRDFKWFHLYLCNAERATCMQGTVHLPTYEMIEGFIKPCIKDDGTPFYCKHSPGFETEEELKEWQIKNQKLISNKNSEKQKNEKQKPQ